MVVQHSASPFRPEFVASAANTNKILRSMIDRSELHRAGLPVPPDDRYPSAMQSASGIFTSPTISAWDVSDADLPTVYPDRMRVRAFTFPRCAAQIVRAMPAFEHILPESPGKSGFMLAGGSMCSLMRGGFTDSTEQTRGEWQAEGMDFDFFAVDLTGAQAEERIEAFLKALGFPDSGVKVYRTPNCVTVMDGETEYQFILRIYGSVGEFLHGFDIAPCAVACDGCRVYFTELAALSHRLGAFPVMPSLRRPTFESRITKYVCKKGFGLILPDLDPVLLRPNTTIELPYLRIHLGSGRGSPQAQPACACLLAQPGEGRPGMLPTDEYGFALDSAEHARSDEAQLVYGALPYTSPKQLVLYNVRRIINRNQFLVWECTELPKPNRDGSEGNGQTLSPMSWHLKLDAGDGLSLRDLILSQISTDISAMENIFHPSDFSDLLQYAVLQQNHLNIPPKLAKLVEQLIGARLKSCEEVTEWLDPAKYAHVWKLAANDTEVSTELDIERILAGSEERDKFQYPVLKNIPQSSRTWYGKCHALAFVHRFVPPKSGEITTGVAELEVQWGLSIEGSGKYLCEVADNFMALHDTYGCTLSRARGRTHGEIQIVACPGASPKTTGRRPETGRMLIAPGTFEAVPWERDYGEASAALTCVAEELALSPQNSRARLLITNVAE